MTELATPRETHHHRWLRHGRVTRAAVFAVLSPTLTLIGVALIAWGQVRWFEDVAVVSAGSVPVALGMALVFVAARPVLIAPGQAALFDGERHASALALWQLLVALVGAGLVAYAADRALDETLPVWDILAWWGAGLLLLVVGVSPLRAMRAWGRMVAQSVRDERPTWVLLGLLTVLGLVIRVAWIGTSPAIFAGDEAQFGYEAVSLKNYLGWHYNPFQLGLWHHPRTYHTLIAATVTVFGQTAAAARFPAAVFGTLTIPAIYVLGRRMFTPLIGWIAALFMLTFPIQLQFSRTGMDMTGDPFFVTLAFAFLVRALRDDDRFEAALAGLTLGLSQYFYFAGRIAVFLLGAYLALNLLFNWRVVLRRKAVLLVLVVLLSATAGPNVYAMIKDTTRPFNPRLAHVSIWETGELARARDAGELDDYVSYQLQHAFLAYVLFQDESDIYGRYNPVMGWYAGVPFLVGVAILLRRWRDPRSVMLLLWPTGTALAGGALLIDPPHYPRYVSATPALAILVAVGVVWGGMVIATLAASVTRLLARLVARTGAHFTQSTRWRTAIPLVLVSVLAALNLWSYTFGYLPQAEHLLYGRSTQKMNRIVRVLDAFGGNYTVVRFSSLYVDMNGTDLFRYLTPENAGQEYRGELAQLAEAVTPGAYAFVIVPDRVDEVLPVLEVNYPGGQLEEYTEPDGDTPLITVYFVDVQAGQTNDSDGSN